MRIIQKYNIPAVVVAILIGASLIFSTSLIWDNKPRNSAVKIYGTNSSLTRTSEALLRSSIDSTKAEKGLVLAIDMGSGEILTAASLYAASYRQKQNDIATSSPWEPGSVMKPLLIAAALEQGAVTKESSFENSQLFVDGYQITNAKPVAGAAYTTNDIINQSINVGAVRIFGDLDGDPEISMSDYSIWHSFLVSIGILDREYSNSEVPLFALRTSGGYAKHEYAQTAIGQNFTTTPLRLTRAYAELLNTARSVNSAKHRTISQPTAEEVERLLHNSYSFNNPAAVYKSIQVGGKSGTARSVNENNQYVSGNDNGTYIGYIDKPEQSIILLTRLDRPETNAFASSEAMKLWNAIAAQLDTSNY